MAAITPLTVVNACLKSMGETPLNSLDSDHPYVQAALNTLDESNVIEQELGWWFNTDYVTLHDDPGNGSVYVPADALNVEADDSMIVQRGNRLWDTGRATYNIGRPVSVKLIREIPFDDLPKNVKQMVSLRAQLDFQAAYDADDAKYQKLYAAYTQAYSRVRRMHIRNQQLNMFHAPRIQRILSGVRPSTRFAAGVMYPYRVR
ncbi:phage tail protein [Pusillimonas sp.]|uniref:phage tail protein n=1 Tax=Pusillimonas sp. TaxID=3040095 RepID=UPI0037C62B00